MSGTSPDHVRGGAALEVDLLGGLDDQEFDIPTVDNPPSLESILNAPDDYEMSGGALGEEGAQYGSSSHLQVSNDQYDETTSVCSGDGLSDHSSTPRHTADSRGGGMGGGGQEVGGGGGRVLHGGRSSVRYEEHGCILRHVVLKGIAAQMSSAADRVDAGLPTALAVASIIAVGTSHGLVLVFDPKQVLKWCLGGVAVGAQFGAVSALSFNIDSTRLLCGFARGQITMWDLTTGKLLRTVTDAHPPGTAILHVKFTDDRTVAVTSDSGGSVFALEFKRLIGVRTCESQCLFSGSRGEVCDIEPLCTQRAVAGEHPMKDVLMLAMASLSKVLIVVIKPQLKVHYIHALSGDSATLPLLAWQFVVIQVTDTERVLDPVLAFARDQTVFFVQVQCRGADDITVVSLQQIEVTYKLLSISWLNSRAMTFIDTAERAHLIDVRSEEELEVIDLCDVQLAYSTSFYKSLATGGNVSKALAYAGERACYQSIVMFNNQLVLLGTKAIHVLTLRSWSERIDVLERKERYLEALNLAQSFYDGKAKAVIGLPSGSTRRREVVGERVMSLLYRYVDLSMTRFCPSHGRVEDLESYYSRVVTTCVEHCLHVGRTDALFTRLYDRFAQDEISRATFLESLEPYILNDSLVSVTPAVMKEFVSHYESRSMLASVEACIVHMDIASLDIHQVVSLCWAYGLYDAILYIYNRGMQDYTTPLEELLSRLAALLSTGKQLTYDQVQLGNKVLVYTSCCLTGRAYPLGDIPEGLVGRVKDDVTRCITSLHTAAGAVGLGGEGEEPAYPHLRTLIQFDTREFFNVLSLSFEDAEFALAKKQRLVDILLQLMVESVDFTPLQVSILFTFLARQMARPDNGIIVDRTLFEQVLESLCSAGVQAGPGWGVTGGARGVTQEVSAGGRGTEEGEGSRHEERQQALLELIRAGGLQHVTDEKKLIALADRAGFYRVCELLYERRREYSLVPVCYWKDSARKHQVFAYIQRTLTSPELTTAERSDLRSALRAGVPHLVRTDARRTAKLIHSGLLSTTTTGVGKGKGGRGGGVLEVIRSISLDDTSLYELLRGVYELRMEGGGGHEVGEEVSPDGDSDTWGEGSGGGMGETSTESTSQDTDTSSIASEDCDLCERYIGLMCTRASAQEIDNFLRNNDNYRTDQALDICRRHDHLVGPVSYLLEKSGEIRAAFELLLDNLVNCLNNLTTAHPPLGGVNPPIGRAEPPSGGGLREVEKIEDGTRVREAEAALNAVIQLSKRHAFRMEPAQREGLWFPLLDTVMAAQQKVKTSLPSPSPLSSTPVVIQEDTVKSMTRRVIDAMTADVPLPAALHRIMSSPAYSSGRFGEMKDLLLGMLDTYNYEMTLLNTCARLVDRDLHGQLVALTAASGRGIALKTELCILCGKELTTAGGVLAGGGGGVGGGGGMEAVCFQCGHGYHSACLVMVGGGGGGRMSWSEGAGGRGGEGWVCIACNKSRRQREFSSSGRIRLSSFAGPAAAPDSASARGVGGAGGMVIGGGVKLEPAQVAAIQSLRKSQRTQSRLAILTELSQRDRTGGKQFRANGSAAGLMVGGGGTGGGREWVGGGLLQNESFALRLAARPPRETL